MKRIVLSAAVLMAALASTGCEHTVRSMYDQPRLDPATQSPLFADGNATRPPPEGSVPHSMGDPAADNSGTGGADEVAQRVAANARTALPQPVTKALLLRGQERYDIYCMPCHSIVGDGDGAVVRHGFPAPPSFHIPRLREAADRHFFEVMTQGYGVMVPYADRLTPEDRWAVVAYLRALQLSQHAAVGDLPAAVLARLPAAPASAASGAG